MKPFGLLATLMMSSMVSYGNVGPYIEVNIGHLGHGSSVRCMIRPGETVLVTAAAVGSGKRRKLGGPHPGGLRRIDCRGEPAA